MAHISEFLGNTPTNDHFALRLWDTMMQQDDPVAKRLASAARDSMVWTQETLTVFVCRGPDGTIGVELGPAGVTPEHGDLHVMVHKIHAGSRAAEEGVLRPCDVIVGVDGINCGEGATFFEVMADLPPNKPYYEWTIRRSTAVPTPRANQHINQAKTIESPREPSTLTQELALNMIRIPQMTRRSSGGIAKAKRTSQGRRSFGSNGLVMPSLLSQSAAPPAAMAGPSAADWDWVRPAATVSTLGRSAAELPTGRPRADSSNARSRPRVPSTGGLSSLLPIRAAA